MERPWAERILDVLDEIQAHLDDDDLDPSRLAERAGFSRHHFHRVFRGMTGESVMGLVRRLRLERAAQRLRFGDTPVTDVAFSSGYQSHEAFTRAFRDRFGMAPRDYRRAAQRRSDEAIDARIEHHDRAEVLGLRHVGPYERCLDAWTELLGILDGAGEEARVSYGLVYDDPEVTAEAHLRYDACVALAPGAARSLAERNPGLRIRAIPAGRYACARHVGPYETMSPTYVALLGQWLPFRGVELCDEPVVEIYVDDPETTPPSELRSDICVRIT